MSFKEQLIDKLDAECKILYIVTEDDKRTAKIIEDYYLEKKEIIGNSGNLWRRENENSIDHSGK